MYTKEEILEMLQNGQDAETLAQSFVDQLNAAIQEKQALDEQAANAKKEKIHIRSEKIQIVDGLMDVLFGFLEEYYPRVYSEELYNEITATDVVDAMDEAYEEVCKFANTLDDFVKIIEKDPKDKNVKVAEIPVETDLYTSITDLIDPIEKFLKENHLK